MNGLGQFRSSVWDPWLIIAQILAMQFVFYTSLCFWIVVVSAFAGSARSLDQVFASMTPNGDSPGAGQNLLVCLLNSVTCVLGLCFVVRRAKSCLDFTATMYSFHLLFCCVYNGAFPTSVSYWLMLALCVSVTTVLAEYACMKLEMREIPVKGASVDI